MVAKAHVSYPADGVGMITIDNPPYNHGTFQLMEQLNEAIQTIKGAGAIVVMMVSDHPKYFCSGAYLPEMMALKDVTQPSTGVVVWFRVANELALGPLISIAVNNGIALGGGAELNWACDIRLAGESAVYGQVESQMGDIPGCGGTVRLPRLIGKGKAIEVLATGRPFSAREMWHFGAVNQIYPDDKLRSEAIKLAASIAKNQPAALRGCKQSINEQFDMNLRDALRNESRIFKQNVASKDRLAALNKAIKIYERGGDSYEAYKLEAPPREYPF